MTESLRCRRLPPEIFLPIIGFLDRDDFPSLNACSLVCKDWTHLARLHRFSSLIFTLQWPSQPVIFPYVRHLGLFHIRFLRNAGDEGTKTWNEIIPLLVGFHRIKSLSIHTRHLDFINAQSWSTLCKNFSGIVSLSLTNFIFTNLSSLAQVFCSFPCLRELSLDGSIDSPSAELASAMTFRSPPNLETLELSGAELHAMLEWFLSHPVRPTLRTVRLYYLDEADLELVDRFIGAFGNDLESLSLSFGDEWTDDVDSIDMTPLTRLRSIEFTVYNSNHQNRWITKTLLRLSSAHVEDVTFKLEYCDPEELDDISGTLEWRHVDAVLQNSTFSRLKKVHVWLAYQVEEINAIERLPRCAARGILCVDHFQ